jgi:Lysozyme like domain/LysM domain
MARRSHNENSNSSDEHSRDLTAQFWGSSPAWSTTGRLRRTRRNGDHTNPVARTRRHGDRTGQIPLVPGTQIEEPLIDPFDFGFDEAGYGLAPGIAGRRIDTRDATTAGGRAQAQPKPVELIELDERPVGRSGDPVSSLAERLGLGAVDPLLLRLGVIVMIGVLLVPLAIGLRPDSGARSVQTEVTAAPSTVPIAFGDVPAVVEDVAPDLVTGSGTDSLPALHSSDEQAAAPTTSPPAPEVALATEPPVTTVSMGDVAEAAGDAESDVAEAVQAPQAMSPLAGGASVADRSANPVASACQLSYTVAAGDYWIRLADAAGIALAKLLQANLATVQTPLYPGDEICLPNGAALPAPPSTTTAAPPTTPPVTSPPTTAAPTTTAPPATTAPVATAPPAPGVIEAIVREVWPDDLEDKALQIAWRESGYRPSAQNWCCYGLFQIKWNSHKSWLDDFGVTSPTQLFDARTNARAAYALYQRSAGWGPWEG